MTPSHGFTGRAILGALLLLALGGPLAAQTPASNPLLRREVDRALVRLGAADSFNARAVAAGTPEAALQMGALLSHHGIGRLDSMTLQVRAEVLLKVFGAADVATCAAWSRGTLDAARSMALFNAMDSVTTSRWADVSARAIVAEMHATTPVPMPTGAEMVKMFTAIRGVMSAADKVKLDELLPRLASAADDENCWFSKAIYGNALRLPVDQRAMALGVIARFEAQ